MESPFPPTVAFVARTQPPEGPPALPPEEEQALGAASSSRRRAQFALGRACARAALAALGGVGDVAVGRAGGRLPQWPAGYVGSITHSHECAAAAVAKAADFQGIGVDLERTRRPSDGLLERVTRPAERERLRALPTPLLPLAFTALFAAKESIYKALNPLTGIYLGFGDAEVRFLETLAETSVAGEFMWTLHKDSGTGFPAGMEAAGAWRRSGEWVVAGVWLAPQKPA